jgi:adenosylhomocysteine nucleosidase
MSVLICFALQEEAAPFRKMADGKPGTTILVTGIGRPNAQKSLRDFLAASPPERVFTCGFAGGLNPDLIVGDVVFELDTMAPAGLREKLAAAGARPASFFCADRIATTVSEKKKLRAETGADAVEMESAAIQAVCREHGLPCATVRVISDLAGEDLPLDFNALSKPDQSLDFGRLAWAIAKSPGKVGPLLALRKNAKFAASRLADVLARVIFA